MTRPSVIPCAWLVAAVLVSGCTSSGPSATANPSTDSRPSPSATAPTTGTPTATASTTPSAGQPLLGGAPVLAVKVDNTAPARPRVGLDAADVVYVEPVEAGLTRLMAIFVSTKPAQVGPIRSARESDAALLANYGRVAFAYSGASPITAAAIGGGRQVNVSMDSGGGGFRRDTSRKAPYNVMGDPVALLARAGGSVPAGDIGFHVGPVASGAGPASSVSTAYPLARLAFTWDATQGRYLVRIDGTPEVTSGGVAVGAATVLVQTVRTHASANRDINGVVTPVLEVIGSGAAQVLRDGQVVTGRWSRPSATAPTVLTSASGAEMTVAAGPLWVVLVPEGQPVTVS